MRVRSPPSALYFQRVTGLVRWPSLSRFPQLSLKLSLPRKVGRLPVDSYEETEVRDRAEDVFRHVYRAYPSLPSPYYEDASAKAE